MKYSEAITLYAGFFSPAIHLFEYEVNNAMLSAQDQDLKHLIMLSLLCSKGG